MITFSTTSKPENDTERKYISGSLPALSNKRQRKSASYKIIDRLNPPAIKAELRVIDREFAITNTHQAQPRRSENSCVDELRSLSDIMVHCPESQEAVTSARKILDSTRRAEVGVARSSSVLRQTRRAIIETSTHFWEWLDITIPQLVSEYLSGIQPGSGKPYGATESWLESLTRDMAGMVFHRQIALHYTLPDYLDVPRRTFTITNSTNRTLAPSDPAFGTHVAKKVVDAILLCLQASHSKHEQARAWAFSMLKRRCGGSFLGSLCAWDLFINFKLTDYTAVSLASVERRDIERCEEAVVEHLQSTGLFSLLPLFEEARETAVLTHDQLMNLYSEGWGDLWTFVQASMRIAKGSEVNGNPQLQKVVTLVRQDRTGCLPFREKVPELQRARREGGFYHPDTVKTTAGIFSALVWRVISFSTPFAREHRMIYESDEDYLEEVKCCEAGSYLCKPNAYGHPIRNNGPALAKTFWQSLTTGTVERWEDFTRGRPTFEECLTYFRTRRGKKNAFPGLGNLLSFLLVCDLSYAGVCPPPDELEVCSGILQTEGGSLKELVALGLVRPIDSMPPDREAQLCAVSDGFGEVVRFLENNLTKEEMEGIGLDDICVEHILCKAHKLGRHLQGARLEGQGEEINGSKRN